jgi:hypothetical protein
MTKTYTVPVQEMADGSGDCFIEFPPEVLVAAGWSDGDTLDWHDNKDGSFTLTKKDKPDTEWVLVEAVSTFRQRYMVEVPKGNAEWAMDTVAMAEAKEFSQEHLGEQIVSHRLVTEAEALVMCDTDNAYTANWADDMKQQAFFTFWEEQ